MPKLFLVFYTAKLKPLYMSAKFNTSFLRNLRLATGCFCYKVLEGTTLLGQFFLRTFQANIRAYLIYSFTQTQNGLFMIYVTLFMLVKCLHDVMIIMTFIFGIKYNLRISNFVQFINIISYFILYPQYKITSNLNPPARGNLFSFSCFDVKSNLRLKLLHKIILS